MAHISIFLKTSLDLVVSACILNQSKGHWLLSNALNFAISMNIKFKDEIGLQTLII
jgi:hypothetical protein